MRVEINDADLLFISGTASICNNGNSIHIEDFRKHTERVHYNIKKLLESKATSWKDVLQTSVFIKEIDKY